MGRRHFFEIIDQSWCPEVIRRGVTDYLQFLAATSDPYRRVLPLLVSALERCGAQRIVDLGSGAGGPWPSLLTELSQRTDSSLELTLTDTRPESISRRWEGTPQGASVTVETEPVDARFVPQRLVGFRTLFSVFHHFRRDDARAVLTNAIAAGEGIAVFEVTHPSLLAILMVLSTPIPAIFVTPFLRPWRLSRFLLTYLVPVIPLVIAFDGAVSCLRTRTEQELEALSEGLEGGDTYQWETQRVSAFPPSPIPVTVFIGTPRGVAPREAVAHDEA